MTQLTENLTVWELWYFKAVTSYRGERFQVPALLTTVTRQTGEYKVDLTRHPKFPIASGELARAVVSHTDLFFNFYTKLAKSSFLCRFRVKSINVFVLPRFDFSKCSSSTNNLTNSHMRKHFPEWVHCQVVWILRRSTLKFYWIQENQTETYFLLSRLFTYDIMKLAGCQVPIKSYNFL